MAQRHSHWTQTPNTPKELSLSQNTKAKAQEISQGAHTLSKYQSPNQSRQNESKPNTTQI